MKNKNRVSRRDFLQKTAAASAGALTLGYLLAGCKGESGGGDAKGGAAADKKPAAADCTDISGLNDADKKTRESLKYVAKSTDPAKNCANCSLYQAPAGGSACGGCSVVKGPIDPKGYCTAWAPKAG